MRRQNHCIIIIFKVYVRSQRLIERKSFTVFIGRYMNKLIFNIYNECSFKRLTTFNKGNEY